MDVGTGIKNRESLVTTQVFHLKRKFSSTGHQTIDYSSRAINKMSRIIQYITVQKFRGQ